MVKAFIPKPDEDEFFTVLSNLGTLIALRFDCKVTIRVDHKDGTFSEAHSDHRNEP